LTKTHRHTKSLLLALLLPLIGATGVRAESVTYSFFGSAWLTGTNFTYVSPTGFLSFDTGPLAPTTATDVFFYNVYGTYFKHDIGALATFDFVSEDELVLKTTTGCNIDFTLPGGVSAVHYVCPNDTLIATSSISGSGYLLNVFTNFNVVGTGGLGITPTDTGDGGSSTPEPSSLALVGISLIATAVLFRKRTRMCTC
jgi:hypothetical protein